MTTPTFFKVFWAEESEYEVSFCPTRPDFAVQKITIFDKFVKNGWNGSGCNNLPMPL